MKSIRTRAMIAFVGMFAFWLVPSRVWASVEADGIYYDLNTSAKTAAVASNPDYYSGAVSIPASFVHDGVTYKVTSIGSAAFLDCSGMIAINMPSSITSIASSAFERCTGLTNLEIGDGVTSISYEAFNNCSNLTRLTLPSSLKSIGNESFAGCSSLTEIISERTTAPTISSSTFNGVDKTSCTVYVPEGYRTSYANAVNWKAFTNIVERTVVATGTCGDNVTYTIYSDMSMVISGSGDMRGAYWEYLDDEYKRSVKNVVIEEGVTSIGYFSFTDCIGITSVSIPSSVSTIGSYAFSGCRGLTSVIISNGVETLLEGAFEGCIGLVSIEIPESVTLIDYDPEHEGVFVGCSNLESIKVNPNNCTYDSRENCNAIIESWSNILIVGCKNTVIPNGVCEIITDAFNSCIGLTSIYIPSSVTGISVGYSERFEVVESSFMGCTNLASISVDPQNYIYDSRDDSNAIIETSANTLIFGCKNTVVPNSVTAIGECAFHECTSLTSIAIPSSVTSIGDYAFHWCYSLTSVQMKNPIPVSINNTVFDGVDKYDCTLYVPTGSKAAYESAYGWRDFQDIVEFDSDTDISFLDNAIYVEQTKGRIGGTMDIPVKLKNSYPVRGFQFKLVLPEGTVINNWKLSTSRLPSGATVSDKISTQKIEGSTITVACSLNYGDATLTGSDGEIATVSVTFSEDMEAGAYPICLTACDVTTASGTDEDLSDVRSTLVLEDYVAGDANGDGKVRIGDATAILNYIVGSVPSSFQEKAADANGDGKIRIGDATAVLNIIVNQ